MKTFLISVFVIILLAGITLFYRDVYVHRKLRKLIEHKYNLMKPLMRKLASDELASPDEILKMANDPSLRHAVFRVLEAYGRMDLFPIMHFTQEKGAESFLVNWLEFPTELGVSPDEIEFITKVTLEEDEGLDYYVFKYNVKEPHPASRNSWMIGVCGPYRKESEPFDIPLKVFSRFKALGSISPEREVQWVHENISK